ncbi:MAG: hypothetical protein HOF21_00895 [Nitrospina sp.]|jgi:YVTN family beta-propeller protein|nr:hypothetical protein [Nitrospina sp.]MBT5633059.1 hypothetical protein [Nitrospina sp.]
MKNITLTILIFVLSFPFNSFSEEVIINDPRSVAVIVNRDSNDLSFMDLKTKKIVGRVFLGKWVNPHMAVLTPDGRRVVTGGTRANRAYIIDVATLKLIKSIPVDTAPEHLAITPDSRYYYQGNPDGDSVSIIDLVSLKRLKNLEGFAEPLNITMLPDGSKAYVANMGAHWVGVIDVKRHELLKKIKVGDVPERSKLDPGKFLGEINGISNATITKDGRYLYAADGDLGIVGVIDTREDRLIKTIKVGENPWRAYSSPDGTKMVVVNNGDETVSIIDIKTNSVIATFEAGPEMIGVNFSNDKAFVISRASSFLYVYDLKSLKPAGRIKIGTGLELETAATDPQGDKLYLASSRDHSIYIIDGKTHEFERVPDVGLYPWGAFILEGQDNYCH